MKTWILRASAGAFVAGLMGSMACGATASSCGGSNINANDTSGTQLNMKCGVGTYLLNNQCVPLPSNSSTGSNATTPTKVITK
jgi:hypothetical protein